jgi:hypothetical protein
MRSVAPSRLFGPQEWLASEITCLLCGVLTSVSFALQAEGIPEPDLIFYGEVRNNAGGKMCASLPERYAGRSSRTAALRRWS